MSLNEQLAVEVCGATFVDEMTTRDIRVVGYEFPDGSFVSELSWNPTTDLNQLRMCYLALSEDERKDFWLSVISISFEQEVPELLDIFENQEMYAQAILKAKGASL